MNSTPRLVDGLSVLYPDVPSPDTAHAHASTPSEQATEFRPSVLELQELARYWYRRELKQELDWRRKLKEVDSDSAIAFCRSLLRLNQIARIIGKRAIQPLIDEVDAEIRMQLREEGWPETGGNNKLPHPVWLDWPDLKESESDGDSAGVNGPTSVMSSSQGRVQPTPEG